MVDRKLVILIGALTLAGCVAQSGGPAKKRAVPDNFHSLMPPQSLLREDTAEAATHDRSASRLAYVGVWATSPDKCAMMDQTAFDGYAVITPQSLRQSGETCTFEPGLTGQGALTFQASCKAGRKKMSRTITVAMQNSERLTLAVGGAAPGRTYVRCHLPK
ncbi:hypothetical protein [uncultured Hoeflea sp.]|uniref:hypothetical protein n=1 Tax=uncultured Hoeflea sp. TaxID=538666 RepID=UPI00262096E1|nr:hypothetical protein [uncultured Hoeflea sp.]